MGKDEKSEGAKLMDELHYESKHIGTLRPEDVAPAMDFSEGYKLFLDASKTERECVRTAEAMAVNRGYLPFEAMRSYQPGDRVYFVNRSKNLFLVTFGRRELSDGVRFNIAHVDSPRLDLKPNPLYEKDELAFLKTHYYGGIRKYQWATIPLSMHGVVIRSDLGSVDICIGERDDEPKFMISDLLPHLSKEQDKRPLSQGLRGEELNVIVGNLPFVDEDVKERFKLTVLKYLSDKYNITEKDFLRAELEIVPAAKAADIGFDRSLVAAYGQDDRVCAFSALKASFEVTDPEFTTVTVLTDKEEIGSDGNTGMASRALHHFMEDIAEGAGVKLREVYRHSICLSSDVNAAFDPTFPDAFEPRNASFLGHGPVFSKYTGSGGKYDSNDASAETMAAVIDMIEREGVIWQAGELGKVDAGGGGTIARFMSDSDVDTVDVGVPVLAMHSPWEITSKLDIYHTFLAYCAFYR